MDIQGEPVGPINKRLCGGYPDHAWLAIADGRAGINPFKPPLVIQE